MVLQSQGAKGMETRLLHFNGPLTFTDGPRCLFDSPHRKDPGVYLWTIQSDVDRRYYIHYVGETLAFAERHRTHLIGILGLNYGIFDPAAARQGQQSPLWAGLWRDKGDEVYKGPGRALAWYRQNPEAVLRYVEALAVFFAPVDGDAQLRKHIEGSIGWNLRRNHEDASVIYPRDNRIGTGAPRGIRLQISAGAPVAGLATTLDI